MKERSFDPWILGLLVLSIALNLGLAYKVHSLSGSASATTTLAVGTQVSEMKAEDLTGRPTQIQFASASKPTVLYVFSPSCHWCARNLGNIKKLYEEEHTNFSFVGVSLGPDNVPQYISESGFPLESVKNPSKDAVRTLHLAGTPETIVIDSTGVVREVWPGAYKAHLCREIEAYFQLPANSLTGT